MRPPFYDSLLLAVSVMLLVVNSLLFVTSCATQTENDRLARIGDVALAYAEQSGKISPEDAALAREVGKLVLTKDIAATAVETSTK